MRTIITSTAFIVSLTVAGGFEAAVAQPPEGIDVNVLNFPDGFDVSGAVSVDNFPATQTVDGTVSVDNFPATQTVNGAVSVLNFPPNQTVTVSNLPDGVLETPLVGECDLALSDFAGPPFIWSCDIDVSDSMNLGRVSLSNVSGSFVRTNEGFRGSFPLATVELRSESNRLLAIWPTVNSHEVDIQTWYSFQEKVDLILPEETTVIRLVTRITSNGQPFHPSQFSIAGTLVMDN